MANLNLVIGARNLTGAAFTSFQNSLNRTGQVASGVRNQLSGITGAIRNFQTEQARVGDNAAGGFNALNTSLLAVAGTVGIVTAAFSGLQKTANSALDAQSQRVNDISTIAQTLGTNIAESTKLTDLARKKISEYGTNLPIATSDVRTAYSLIIDDYSNALKGKLANDQIINVVTADAARLGILKDSLPESAKGAFGSNITSLLSGATGLGGFPQLALYANVPFRNAFTQELQRQNVKSLGQLDPISRVQSINRIIEASVTDQQIGLLASTGKAKLSSLTDRLFDDESGIFSFARNLGKDGEERKTVVDSFTETLDKLFGDRGLVAQIGRLGWFKGDPIKPIYDAVVGVNKYLDGVNEYLSKLKSLSPAEAGSLIGKGVADVTNAIVDGIIGAISSVDWGAVGTGLAYGIGSFLANLDWKVYAGAAIGVAVAAAIPTIVGAIVLYGGTLLGVLAAGISAAVGGLPLLVIGAIGLGIVAIGKLIIDNWEGIKKTAGNVGNWLKSGFDSFMGGVRNVIKGAQAFTLGTLQFLFGKEGTAALIEFAQNAIKTVNQWGAGLLTFVGDFIRGAGDFFNWIGSGIKGIFDFIGGALNSLMETIKSVVNAIIQPLQGAVSGLASSVSGYVTNVQNTGGLINPQNALPIVSTAINPLGAATNFAVEKIAGFLGFGARYGGNIPTAVNGLFDALAVENARKPNSAGLVVANTSELILPQSQIAPFVNANRRPSVSFGNINISLNLQGNTPIEIAEQAISLIEERLTSEIEASLA